MWLALGLAPPPDSSSLNKSTLKYVDSCGTYRSPFTLVAGPVWASTPPVQSPPLPQRRATMAAQTLQTEPAPLTPGDRVVVYRTRELEDVPESADIIEGEATLSSRLTEDATGELWEVRFDGEPGAYVRWVTLEDRVTLAGRQP